MLRFCKNTELFLFLKGTVASILLAASCLCASAGDRIVIKGIVRDSLTTEGLPYASITIDGTQKGTVADERGIFEVVVAPENRYIIAAYQGYGSKKIFLKQSSLNLYDIYLAPQNEELKEVVVKRGKYSKRNNPAVEFAERLRKSAPLTDPRRNDYYSYDAYRRTSVGIGDFNTDSTSALIRRFPFLAEHTDTSEINGMPVLNLSIEEKATSTIYRKNPESLKEIVKGRRSRGVDEMMDTRNLQTLLDDMLREVDLYQSDVKLLKNSFVSPLSAIAPDFYRFYLVDTTKIDGVDCTVLAFYPRNKSSNGFSGHVFVETGDSSMFIHRIEMHVADEINLNFIRSMILSQNYERASDGSRWKESDDIVLDASLLPGTAPLYISRKIRYKNHSYDLPPDSASFEMLGETLERPDALIRDDDFWVNTASLPARQGENQIDNLSEKLRNVPLFYWGEKILRIMFTGYISTGKNSKFDFGPVNTLASYNSLEGLRLRAGGITTANLSPHWFGRAYAAYGFRDHKWKYSAEAEYSFNEKHYHSREFPIHSLRFTHSYDVDHLGSHYLFTNSDNFVLSLRRMSNHNDVYKRRSAIEYTLELGNNLSFGVTMENVRLETSRYVDFTEFSGRKLSHYTENILGVRLRYAPGEKFMQTKSYRIPVNEDAPTFVIEHKFAPKGFLGSKYSINKTEINLGKRFWMSFLGSIDIMVGGGHVWSSAPFPELLIPNANISYTIQPQSFALMNPMEFVNSSYVSWDICYQPRGALFNLIPGFRKLGLREIIGFRGLYGHLSSRSIPSDSRPELLMFPENAGYGMPDGPYMEISAGLDNILRILRLDYVWRLSYRHTPYAIDRSGLRVALHFTF